MRKCCRGPEDPRGPSGLYSQSEHEAAGSHLGGPADLTSQQFNHAGRFGSELGHSQETGRKSNKQDCGGPDHREALMPIVDTPVLVPPAREHLALRRPI